jgi:hypothetical protein
MPRICRSAVEQLGLRHRPRNTLEHLFRSLGNLPEKIATQISRV